MKLDIVNNDLIIEWEWYELLLAVNFENPFKIPLTAISGVSTEEPSSNWRELRIPGTFLPGVIKAGTYYTPAGREFWYVTSDRNYLILNLQNHNFTRIILTLDDNLAWRDRLAQ